MFQQQAGIINAQSTTIQQQGTTITTLQNSIGSAVADALSHYTTNVVQPMFTALIGGSLPGSLDTLVELVNQLQADETGAAAMLASITSLATRLGTAENALLGKAATATVTTLQAAVTQHTTDIAGKLSKAGDTATGSIMMPNAVVAAAAPRLDQTYGGLNSPIRAAYAFGGTAVALGPGPLTDPTPQGRMAQVIQVFLSMKTAPTLGLNVTVKLGTTPGGSEIFSRQFLLTALPGLSALLASVPTSIPSLPAGTILYAQAVNATLANSPGAWDMIVQSYYRS